MEEYEDNGPIWDEEEYNAEEELLCLESEIDGIGQLRVQERANDTQALSSPNFHLVESNPRAITQEIRCKNLRMEAMLEQVLTNQFEMVYGMEKAYESVHHQIDGFARTFNRRLDCISSSFEKLKFQVDNITPSSRELARDSTIFYEPPLLCDDDEFDENDEAWLEFSKFLDSLSLSEDVDLHKELVSEPMVEVLQAPTSFAMENMELIAPPNYGNFETQEALGEMRFDKLNELVLIIAKIERIPPTSRERELLRWVDLKRQMRYEEERSSSNDRFCVIESGNAKRKKKKRPYALEPNPNWTKKECRFYEKVHQGMIELGGFQTPKMLIDASLQSNEGKEHEKGTIISYIALA